MKALVDTMLRFTIRDLLWLMVVVALGVGWRVEWNRAATAERQRRERFLYVTLLEETVEHMLRLWEADNPGSVTRQGGDGNYVVHTKSGRHYFPFRFEREIQPAKR